ncbi:MAG: T9SS type A sorting domain-containing protein [Bacteroidetes bacterium]|nr:T9SS type A sorting domain-containing protein [Bacteroidota bacterium]
MKTRTLLLSILVIIFLSASKTNAQPKLWGTLPLGGSTEAGMVYEFNLDGKIMNEIYDFKKYLGRNPRHQVLLADNNKFYGIANGGYDQFGSIIYEYDPESESFTVVHDFYDTEVQHSYSAGSVYLMQASDGLIYGFTHSSGVTSDGQIFSFKAETREFYYLADFTATTTGSYPIGGLIEAGDGKLYGLTGEGGGCNCGMLFSFDPSNNLLESELEFGGVNGSKPNNGLLLASNGILYGMAREGGTNGQGTIFSFETGTGIFTLLHDFNPATDGGRPYGRLFQASDGYLYGMASEGGASSLGIIFRYDINLDLFYVRYSFDGPTGSFPLGSFIEYQDNLYAMAANGGVADKGVLLRYDHIANTVDILVDLYGVDYGEYPDGSLTIGPEGKLYGQVFGGGKYGLGIMFNYNTANSTFTKCFDFGQSDDGTNNYSSLMMGSDGWVYGTTAYGGEHGAGTIFRIHPSDRQFESLYAFDMTSYGGTPLSGLMQASDGYYYGVTPYGGSVNFGVIYRFNASNGLLTVLEDLITLTEGMEPSGTPVQASDGFLYGLTNKGGAMGDGALYKFNLSNSTYAKQVDFQGAASGSHPVGSLVEAANGKLYALAAHGGQFGYGTLFEYDPLGGTFFALVQFDGLSKGALPVGTLLEFEDNKLYGMCTNGGVNDAGTIFMYDALTNICTKLHDFNLSNNGAVPISSLMKASNSKIYGTTKRGGSYDSGVLFEYEPSSGNYTVFHEFSSFREYPWYSALLEVETDYGVEDRSGDISVLSLYPNPANKVLKISSKQWLNSRVNIKVINQLGQLMIEQNAAGISAGTIELDVESLEPGIYFIHCHDVQGRSSLGKFVKAK